MKKIFLSLLFCIFSTVAHAQVTYDINDPEVVAQMGKLVLSKKIVELFWQSYNHPSRPISPPQAMQRIIDDALLAEHARKTLPAEVLNQENKVGFLLSVQSEDRTIALIRKSNEQILRAAIEKLPGKSLDALYTFNKNLSKEKYQTLFSLKSKVNIEATPEQQQLAKNTVIANLELSGQKTTLTLWDIYLRQNVQGRLAMHNADMEHLKSEIRQRVGSLFVLDWANNNLPERDLKAIKQVVLNEQHKTTLLKSMGLYADVHDDNPVLREKALTISNDEILSFYENNKEEFAVVERVKARHLQVSSQELADKIHHEIEHGLDFSEAVKKHSIADDKNTTPPGDLGWLERKDKKRSWLHSVAFTHKKGQLSVPFRSPQNQGKIVYEIIYVDDRIDGYLPFTDPTVRYEASRDIALKQLQEEFHNLQKELRQRANIHLNKQALTGK